MIELDAYVDDELPDYIMVMVANDRTQVKCFALLASLLAIRCSVFEGGGDRNIA